MLRRRLELVLPVVFEELVGQGVDGVFECVELFAQSLELSAGEQAEVAGDLGLKVELEEVLGDGGRV